MVSYNNLMTKANDFSSVCHPHTETHQNGTNEAHLKDRGSQIEDEGAEDEGDAPGAAVYGLGQGSCLAAKMKTQIQIVQV